jgi:hypothetical protein
MNMGVKHHLAGGVEIVHHDVKAPGEQNLAQGLGHPAGDLSHFQPQVVGQIEKVS